MQLLNDLVLIAIALALEPRFEVFRVGEDVRLRMR